MSGTQSFPLSLSTSDGLIGPSPRVWAASTRAAASRQARQQTRLPASGPEQRAQPAGGLGVNGVVSGGIMG